MHTNKAGAREREFLSFTLGGLEYGLDFGKVRELRAFGSLERLATDGQLIGNVALSGGVIMPIVDMRAAFAGRAVSPDPVTDVIVLQLTSCVVGMVVERVIDVVSLSPEHIAPVPGADGAHADYLVGLAQVRGRRLILVDIDRLMSVRRQRAGTRQVA